MLLLLLAAAAWGTTYTVNPDGSGDFATIQAAIGAAVDDDIVELTNGTNEGDGNRDIDFLGKAITLRSQGGDRGQCIIDCGGSAEERHRGLYLTLRGKGGSEA